MYSRDGILSSQTSQRALSLRFVAHPSIVLSSVLSFCFRSCSMICLLQLCLVSSSSPQLVVDMAFVLSAREESTLLGHLIAVLSVCADHPGHSDDAAENETHGCGVPFPVGGSRVPTSGWRPDVLWVSMTVN